MAIPMISWLCGIEDLIESPNETLRCKNWSYCVNVRKKVMSLFSMPTREVVQIVRNLITDSDDRFECLLTLRWTDRHTAHHTLNTWHPVTNSLRFAILPNEKRMLHP